MERRGWLGPLPSGRAGGRGCHSGRQPFISVSAPLPSTPIVRRERGRGGAAAAPAARQARFKAEARERARHVTRFLESSWKAAFAFLPRCSKPGEGGGCCCCCAPSAASANSAGPAPPSGGAGQGSPRCLRSPRSPFSPQPSSSYNPPQFLRGGTHAGGRLPRPPALCLPRFCPQRVSAASAAGDCWPLFARRHMQSSCPSRAAAALAEENDLRSPALLRGGRGAPAPAPAPLHLARRAPSRSPCNESLPGCCPCQAKRSASRPPGPLGGLACGGEGKAPGAAGAHGSLPTRLHRGRPPRLSSTAEPSLLGKPAERSAAKPDRELRLDLAATARTPSSPGALQAAREWPIPVPCYVAGGKGKERRKSSARAAARGA